MNARQPENRVANRVIKLESLCVLETDLQLFWGTAQNIAIAADSWFTSHGSGWTQNLINSSSNTLLTLVVTIVRVD